MKIVLTIAGIILAYLLSWFILRTPREIKEALAHEGEMVAEIMKSPMSPKKNGEVKIVNGPPAWTGMKTGDISREEMLYVTRHYESLGWTMLFRNYITNRIIMFKPDLEDTVTRDKMFRGKVDGYQDFDERGK